VTDVNRPLLGEPNAPCRQCGAPLAADQRYCLQCGTRRAEARLPFLDILASQVPGPAAPSAMSTTVQRGPAGRLGRLSTNAAAVAGIACLILALGVGVLIGGLGADDSAAGGTPQVISVGGAAPAAAAAPTTAAPAATETTAPDAAAVKRAKAKATRKKAASPSTSKATNSTVKQLDGTSGSDYTKKAAKLPRQVGTGGKAPPKDTSGKAIGGGSDVQEIG
jgi:hypothetical protein